MRALFLTLMISFLSAGVFGASKLGFIDKVNKAKQVEAWSFLIGKDDTEDNCVWLNCNKKAWDTVEGRGLIGCLSTTTTKFESIMKQFTTYYNRLDPQDYLGPFCWIKYKLKEDIREEQHFLVSSKKRKRDEGDREIKLDLVNDLDRWVINNCFFWGL